MARIRQQHPGNYLSSGTISTEFENVIRYLNSAELGNKTLEELLRVLFDDDGEFDGPVEFRVDSEHGLQYRIGDYAALGLTNPEVGWITLISLEDMKGADGSVVGSVLQPVLHTRVDYVADPLDTTFDLAMDADDGAVVFLNGVLQIEGADYTLDKTGTGAVVFTATMEGGENVSLYRLMQPIDHGTFRQDYVLASVTTTFVFPFTADDTLQVYHNGVLMTEGADKDYILAAEHDLVIFNDVLPEGDRVTIIRLQDSGQAFVPGIMLQASYCDSTTGLILFNRIGIDDGAIPQAKVEDLVAAMAVMATMTISATTPDPETLFWINTAETPNGLYFWDGLQYLPAAPNINIPVYGPSNALQYLRVNSAGNGLQWTSLDLSAYIPRTEKGAANGVASLGATGTIPEAQMPEVYTKDSISIRVDGATADGNYQIRRYYALNVRLTHWGVRSSAGTAQAQIALNGIDVGDPKAVSTTPNEGILADAIDVDATVNSVEVGVNISAGSGLTDLEVVIGVEITR